jgi:hypothetical protein
MFKDRLNTDLFIEKNGKNYRLPINLNLDSVRQYFEHKGYKVIFLDQMYRHVHGKLEKDGQAFFLKLASTQDIGERTHNEKIWNENLNKQLHLDKITDFTVPGIIDFGFYDKNKYFFISEYFEGKFVATKNPPNNYLIEECLDQIVSISNYFLQLPAKFSLPRDDLEYSGQMNFFDHCYKQDSKLISELKEYKLEAILSIERETKLFYQLSINHGDFVPWHLIINNTKLVLIDAEQGSFKLPRYFDVVYFYSRLYTGAYQPEMAKKYLQKVRENLSRNEKENFIKAIRPLIANRLIGGFWHAKNETKGIEYQQMLKSDLLSNNFL